MNHSSTARPSTRSCARMLLACAICCPMHLAAQASNLETIRDSQRALMDAAVGTDRGSVVSQAAYVDQVAFTFTQENKPATPEAAEAAASLLKYSVGILGAGDFNSNAGAASAHGIQSVEGDPQLRLGLSKLLSSPAQQWALQLSGLLLAGSDRFVRLPAGDMDSATADVRVQAVDKRDDQAFSPFVDYSSSLGFTPTFMAHDGTSHDLTFGFDKAFNYESDRTEVDHQPDTSRDTSWSIGITSTVTRRFNEASSSVLLLTAQPSLTYNSYDSQTGIGANAQWNVSLAFDVSRKLHDQSADFAQKDWVIDPILTTVFTPPWKWFSSDPASDVELASYKAWGMPKIVLQAAYLRVFSNLAGARFHQLTVGPTIKLSWGS